MSSRILLLSAALLHIVAALTIPGFNTTYEVKREGVGSVTVAKGSTVTVHATGIVAETDKKFWSTKDPGQQPFTYKAGVGGVITGWDRGCLGMKARRAAARLRPTAAAAPTTLSAHSRARAQSRLGGRGPCTQHPGEGRLRRRRVPGMGDSSRRDAGLRDRSADNLGREVGAVDLVSGGSLGARLGLLEVRGV